VNCARPDLWGPGEPKSPGYPTVIVDLIETVIANVNVIVIVIASPVNAPGSSNGRLRGRVRPIP
jgi:hypothetical protein